MSKKRRRPRPVTPRSAAAAPVGAEASPRGTKTASPNAETAGASPALTYPPLGLSAARGLAAAGGAPVLLVTSFLAALALWGAFTGYGAVLAATPAAMVQLEALPPVHLFLLDLPFLSAGRVVSTATIVAFATGLVVARAGLLSLWTSLLFDSLGAREPAPNGGVASELPAPDAATGHRPGPSSTRAVLRRAARSFVPMLGVEVGFLFLALVSVVVLGSFLGQLGLVLSLIVATHFLVFAPVIVVAEGAGALKAARLAVRAARIPGPRHMLLVFSYFAVAIFLVLSVPGSRVAHATPSIAVWAYCLFVSFLHLSVLGAFAYRWLAVRDRVVRGDVLPARTRNRARAGAKEPPRRPRATGR